MDDQRFFNLESWEDLWARIGYTCKPEDIQVMYPALDHYYSEPERAYHNKRHINQCLGMLDKYRHLAEHPESIALALWYHDAIYLTYPRPFQLPTSEALSAAVCDHDMHRAGANYELRKVVQELIAVTDHKPYEILTRDQELIVDIDWSVVGWPYPQYEEQRKQIRAEYSHYTDEEFRAGSIAFFKKALERPKQFHLPEFQSLYENQARYNLERALKEIEAA